MKTILEFLQTNHVNANKLFTEEEMWDDYEAVRWCYTKKEKLQYMEKYHCQIAKIGDIQHAILLELKNVRDSKKSNEFNTSDVKGFGYLSDWPETYNKIEKFLNEETKEFVLYLAEFYEQRLKDKKMKNGKTLFDLVSLVKTRSWNYYMTSSDKYQIMKYINVKRYIEQHNL